MTQQFDDDFQNPNEGSLSGYVSRLRELNSQITELEIRQHHGRALAELAQITSWQQMQKDLSGLHDRLLNGLVTKELNPYSLGLQQGFIRALRVLTKDKVPDGQEFEEMRVRLAQLTDERDELNALVDAR